MIQSVPDLLDACLPYPNAPETCYDKAQGAGGEQGGSREEQGAGREGAGREQGGSREGGSREGADLLDACPPYPNAPETCHDKAILHSFKP